MRILVASDKFKGSLTAAEACRAIASGIESTLEPGSFELKLLPIADGGDGMANTITCAAKGDWLTADVTNAQNHPTTASYGLINKRKVAIIEMAEASGLAQLGNAPLDPWSATSIGTGQLIQTALSHGVEKIVLGIGGSATNDGGAGMAQALGFRFYNSEGQEVENLPEELSQVSKIEAPESTVFPPITVACDVTNPLLGPNGCTRIYGPQKGIQENAIQRHEARLSHLVDLLGQKGETAAAAQGAGAAGGLGFGCLAFLDAQLVPGFDLVASLLNLPEAVDWADLVITGEGKLDRQSLQGKAPYGIASLARSKGKNTGAFCGRLEDKSLESEFGPITEIASPDFSTEENMARGEELLRSAAATTISSLLESPPRSAHQRL